VQQQQPQQQHGYGLHPQPQPQQQGGAVAFDMSSASAPAPAPASAAGPFGHAHTQQQQQQQPWHQPQALPHPILSSPVRTAAPKSTPGGGGVASPYGPHGHAPVALPAVGVARTDSVRISSIRPPAPLVSLGVGGKLVFMVPERARRLSSMGPTPFGAGGAGAAGEDTPLRKGPVHVRALRVEVCSYHSSDWFKKLPGIETSRNAMAVSVPRSKDYALDANEKLLWGLVALAVQNDGGFRSHKGE
jgi:hypothetical protein